MNAYAISVSVGGTGRVGSLDFTDPEIFSCVISNSGVHPVVSNFPRGHISSATPEDLFLEKLWAYLAIRQLIDQDVAAIESESISDIHKNVKNDSAPRNRALRLAMKVNWQHIVVFIY